MTREVGVRSHRSRSEMGQLKHKYRLADDWACFWVDESITGSSVLVQRRFFRLRRNRDGQEPCRFDKRFGPSKALGKMNDNAANRFFHEGTDFKKIESQRIKLSRLEHRTVHGFAKMVHKNVSQGMNKKPERVGCKFVATQSIGFEGIL